MLSIVLETTSWPGHRALLDGEDAPDQTHWQGMHLGSFVTVIEYMPSHPRVVEEHQNPWSSGNATTGVGQRRPCCRATVSATFRWVPARPRVSSSPAYGLPLSGLTSAPRRTQTSAGRIR